MGLPHLRETGVIKVREGNDTMTQSALFIEQAARQGTPVLFENPIGSRIFGTTLFKRIMSVNGFSRHALDQCSFGARWRKRTAVLSWHCDASLLSGRLCCGHGGMCSHSGIMHIILQGRDRGTNKLWTTLAQAYPSKLATVFARILAESADAAATSRIYDLGCGFAI